MTGKVETGIPGLDEMLEGGLMQGSSTILIGGCGVGKSTLCMQYLVNGAKKYYENGVYVTFNETPEILQRNMQGYHFGLEKLMEKNKLTILRLDPKDLLQVIREDYGEIRDVIKENNARRFVLDPLSTFNIVVKDEFERKMSLLKFCEWLRKHGCTSLMTLERERHPSVNTEGGFEMHVVDGVIIMYNLQVKNSRVNALEILKMRGSGHSKKIAPFTFEEGINVSPDENLFWTSNTL